MRDNSEHTNGRGNKATGHRHPVNAAPRFCCILPSDRAGTPRLRTKLPTSSTPSGASPLAAWSLEWPRTRLTSAEVGSSQVQILCVGAKVEFLLFYDNFPLLCTSICTSYCLDCLHILIWSPGHSLPVLLLSINGKKNNNNILECRCWISVSVSILLLQCRMSILLPLVDRCCRAMGPAGICTSTKPEYLKLGRSANSNNRGLPPVSACL